MRFFEKVVLAFVVCWFALAAWPASFWYKPGQMEVPNFVSGVEELPIIYFGGPVRDFQGSYTVVVRSAVTGEIHVEDKSGVFPYRTGSQRPDPLLMGWWAPRHGKDIRSLPGGDYALVTCWTVYPPAWLAFIPAKTICHEPALFHVSAPLGAG